MKKLIIIMLCIISFMSVTFALTETEENTIDRVITRWHARQSENQLVGRVNVLLNRINEIQARARLTQTGAEVLNYIEARLMRILNAATGTGTSLITENPVVYNNAFPSTITIPTQRETRPLLMLGGEAKPIAKLDFVVNTESMIIETVTVYASSNQLPEYTQQAALYDEGGNFIASSYVTSDTIIFDNLSFERKPGSHQFYVYVLPANNNSYIPYTPITVTISSFGLVAKGAITGSKITKTALINSNIVTTATIAPVAIDTVQFVNTTNGYSMSTFLSQGTNTLGLLSITTPANNSIYSRDIIIDHITVTVNDATTARNIASILKIERLDNGSNVSLYGTANGNTVTFTINTNSTLSTLQQGQKALYRFVANIQLDPAIHESIELMILNLKNGGITYHSKDSTTPITTIQQWDRETASARLID